MRSLPVQWCPSLEILSTRPKDIDGLKTSKISYRASGSPSGRYKREWLLFFDALSTQSVTRAWPSKWQMYWMNFIHGPFFRSSKVFFVVVLNDTVRAITILVCRPCMSLLDGCISYQQMQNSRNAYLHKKNNLKAFKPRLILWIQNSFWYHLQAEIVSYQMIPLIDNVSHC